ncbi:Arc family DNA-binding protein [Methylobacterium sp. E-005]|uniref:Arc family DNA-binding protein n=1 Tax=Methylobacterium sp. E-005 TaxID=2836549 RepID=UPI001FB908FA|nr:Arc family DNA-binding protein [Methylobacterium sp. E-005]MCJ2086376.1 Arc family DNA-binding protein [Methylobacterium sp. E-005]
MNEPKKRGRPPKPAAERRRHNQTFRCNDEMLARLQAVADKNQRSISEEVERRLEESFSNENLLEDLRSAAYAASEQAWDDYVKRQAGEQRFLKFGLEAASLLRYAMRDLNIYDKDISDIAKSKGDLENIIKAFTRQLPGMLDWVDKSDFDLVLEINKKALRSNMDIAPDETKEK